MSVSKWRQIKLGDVIEINKNSYSAHDDWDYINYLDTGNITENRIDNIQYLDTRSDKIPSRAKRKVNANEIIYSTVRPNQKHYGIIKKPFANMLVSTGFAVINGKDGLADNGFLYWYLTQEHIVELLHTIGENSTSAYPSIKPSDIEGLDISLPTLAEQRTIAATLSALDDMIELNNQINKTLEEMAQAIFKSWFVDFEPFRDGEFEESELGLIPKGWRVGVLGDIIDIFDSKRVPLSNRQRSVMEKKYPYYGAATLMDYVDNYIFDGVYVLLGEDGTVMDEKGYPILQYVWGKFWVNNHAHVLKGKGVFSDEYLYILLKNTNVASIVTGAVQLKINQNNLTGLKIMIPPEDVVKQYNDVVKDIFACFRSNADEIKILISLRDTLLPKLISGEIRVPVDEVV